MNLFHYIQGKRKGKDAHHIEREAMQDPFLAEALEGYDAVPGEHGSAIERMQQQVMHSGPSKNRNILFWTSVAASILLISGIGWYLLRPDTSGIPALSVADSIPQSETPASIQSIHQSEQVSRTDLQQEKSVPPPAPSPALNIVEDLAVVDDLLALEEEMIITEESDSFDQEKSELSDEVTVTAFGKQKKVSIVESVTTIDPKDLKEPSRDLTSVMGGRVAGVISYQRSGEQEKNISEFWVRGIGTLEANSGALVLIDGQEGDIDTLDITDIDSFSVLKDSSVTAMYGVKGANEVILITTKQHHLSASAQTTDATENTSKLVADKTMANKEKKSALKDKHQLKIRGKVVDESGEPLPGVSIVSENQRTGTITGVDGKFELTVQDSTTISASFIGYELQQMKADTSMIIAMHESEAQLDEVTVVAFGSQRRESVIGSARKAAAKEEKMVIPEPVIGKRAYKKYLEKELIHPTDNLCANVKGKVMVRFYVNESGRPYNLQIMESLCGASDQEAMRLINEGSDWTAGNAYVEVEVKF